MTATQKPTIAAPEAGAVQVEQADRIAAWPFAPKYYRNNDDALRWLAGVYDHAAPVIQAFARHRLAAQAQPTPRGESGAREAATIEAVGLEIADLIERHMKSSAMIWSLGKDLPDDWMAELRSITVAALESEIPKLLSTPIPTGEGLREAADNLALAADRVDRKYGHYEDGSPCDWTEWQNVREAVAAARNALAMGGGS